MNKVLSRGQSLWEVVIALGVAGLIALGLVKAVVSSIKSSRFSQDQNQMTALAQTRINQIIDYKNQNRFDFWDSPHRPPLIPEEEYNEDEDYCLLTEVTDKTNNLPTETPDRANSRMALISVDVFWELKSSEEEGVDCDHKDFSHKLHFETYVTN